MKKIKIMTAIIAMTLVLSACGKTITTPIGEYKDFTIGKFEGRNVTYEELLREMNPLAIDILMNYGEDFFKKDGTKVEDGMHLMFAEKIMEDLVLLEEIKALGDAFDKAGPDKMAEERLQAIKEEYGEEFSQALKKMNFKDEEDYLGYLKKEEYLKAFYKGYEERAEVTEAEVQERYERDKEVFVKRAGADIFHIYLGTEEKNALEDGKKVLEALAASSDKTGTFTEMAKTYSQDKGAGDNGSIGYYPYDTAELHKDFMDHVKQLNEGEISGIVKSSAGYHIIRVENIQEEDQTMPLESVFEDIEEYIRREKVSAKWTEDLTAFKKKYKIEIYQDKFPLNHELETVKEGVETGVEK